MKPTADTVRIVSWLAYPAVMLIGIGIYTGLVATTSAYLLTAYGVVIGAAMLITLLEYWFPYDKNWIPAGYTAVQDAIYMVVVQMLLPRLLTIGFIFVLIEPLGKLAVNIHDWWPHQLPIFVQVVLMVLGADFLRYWLHRAAHQYSPLWRLHAVHHSPHQLYWLNVGRFHPLEKALQFLFDTLPFILLGVSEEVIAFYFVFYAINGFFQHSNVELRFGVLNYLVSSAELHRWHHSVLPAESNTNYGNNTIVWDLLFGTWFLPHDRDISVIGLKNRHYPEGFVDQLKTPFTPLITDKEVRLQGYGQKFMQLLLSLRMWQIYWQDVRQVTRAAIHPDKTQDAVLKDIIDSNADTRFGLEHNFKAINSFSEYTRQVPIQDYESLRQYIDEQDEQKISALTSEQPLMYAVTSGTTGQPKHIPVLPLTLTQYQREQRIYSWVQYQYSPAAFDGKVLCFAGAAEEGVRESGSPYGSISGYLYKSMPAMVQRNYVVPAAVFEIADHILKYKVMLRLALEERNITFLVGANSTSFLRLLALLNESVDEYVESLSTGGFRALETVDNQLHAALLARMPVNAARASELKALAKQGSISFADLWPDIALLSIWTGGSCGVALRALKSTLPEDIKVMDLGYMSSELRVSITIDPVSGAGVPTFQHAFYEFVPVDEWQENVQKTYRLGELKTGHDYYVIVTTASGLYRYSMNDVVRVVGRYKNTPTIVFLRKGKGVTSITGEKLYEDQVLAAMDNVQNEMAFTAAFFMMLADTKSGGYRLYIESEDMPAGRHDRLSGKIDEQLSGLNMEYAAKRQSGRLSPPEVYAVSRGTGEAYKKYCLAQGQREGQFKVVALQYADDVAFDFSLTVTDQAE